MSNETQSRSFIVFISYSWNYNKPLVNDLYRFLAKNGIRAWKDDEGGMAGSTIRSMQSGIKMATGMVICASDAYLDSPMCRLELDYSKPVTLVKLEPECDLREDILLCNHLYIQDDDKDNLFARILDDLKQKYFPDKEKELIAPTIFQKAVDPFVVDEEELKTTQVIAKPTSLQMVKLAENKNETGTKSQTIALIPFGIESVTPFNVGMISDSVASPTETGITSAPKMTLEEYLKRQAMSRARRWIMMGGFMIVFICMMGVVSLSVTTVIGTLDSYPINLTSVYFNTLLDPFAR